MKKMFPKMRFCNFSSAWSAKKLGEIGETIIGLTYSPNDIVSVEDQGSIVLRSCNVKNNSICLEDLVKVSCPIRDDLKMKQGDILICVRNGSQQLIGKNLYFNRDEKNFTFGAFMSVFRSKNNFFVKHLLETSSYRKQIQVNLGARINQITNKNIREFKFYFPEPEEQQKIASFLTSVDKKIQQLTRKKELLEQYKKGMMQKIFSQEIRFKDDNGNNFPEWEEKKLGDFLKLTLREIEKPDKEYLAIGIRSHCKGTFQKPDFQPDKIEMDKLYKVKEGDLIVNITFAWEGAIALVKAEDTDGLVSHRFPTYTFNESKVLKDFFKFIFVTDRFVFWLGMISPGGAGRNRVMNRKDFLKLKVEVPKLAEQKKISEFLTSIEKKIELTGSQLEKAKEFKKGLLQQMFV